MSIYDLAVKTRDGKDFKLSELKGKVLLVVNTATGCGFTPQYEGLENLYEKYHDKGLEVLDFPCNQFGHQAPGDDNEIHSFCTAKYKTQFDQFAKIMAMKAVVKISSTCKKEGDIVWNFTKFLVSKDGKVVKRFDPTFKPEDMEEDIKGLL